MAFGKIYIKECKLPHNLDLFFFSDGGPPTRLFLFISDGGPPTLRSLVTDTQLSLDKLKRPKTDGTESSRPNHSSLGPSIQALKAVLC